MGYIRIKYKEGGVDISCPAIDDKINYRTTDRKFTVLTKTKALDLLGNPSSDTEEAKSPIKTVVEGSEIETFKYTDNANYVTTDYYIDDGTKYYFEDGTAISECPACKNRPGFIKGDDDQYYTCPKCKGRTTIIRTTIPATVLGLTLSQTSLDEGGFDLKYKIVPNGSTKSVYIDYTDVIDE